MKLKDFYEMAKAAIPVEVQSEGMDVKASLNDFGTDYAYEVALRVGERWRFGTGTTPEEAIQDIRKRLGYVPKVDIEITV